MILVVAAAATLLGASNKSEELCESCILSDSLRLIVAKRSSHQEPQPRHQTKLTPNLQTFAPVNINE